MDFILEKFALEVDDIHIDKETTEMLDMADLPDVERQEVSTAPTCSRPLWYPPRLQLGSYRGLWLVSRVWVLMDAENKGNTRDTRV
jgi:hypothetical protein